jgi:hypothetical protein
LIEFLVKDRVNREGKVWEVAINLVLDQLVIVYALPVGTKLPIK